MQELATRAAVLAALRLVDLVVPFEEDTPEKLVRRLSPDVLFKGADYAESEVIGGDFVKANGGRVELLPLLPGHSTTSLVGRLAEERVRGAQLRRAPSSRPYLGWRSAIQQDATIEPVGLRPFIVKQASSLVSEMIVRR